MFVNFKLKDFTYDGQDCYMVVVQDKTSQIALDNLKVKNDKLKLENEMAKFYAACISHDMKAPIGAISKPHIFRCLGLLESMPWLT